MLFLAAITQETEKYETRSSARRKQSADGNSKRQNPILEALFRFDIHQKIQFIKLKAV